MTARASWSKNRSRSIPRWSEQRIGFVQTGTTTEQNLADYFKSNNMKYEVIAFGHRRRNRQGLRGFADAVALFTSDVSQLYAERLKL